MMKRIDHVYRELKKLCAGQYKAQGLIEGFSADKIATGLKIHRSNASGDLNLLFREGRIEKTAGKPVLYRVSQINRGWETAEWETDAFSNVIGADLSLKNAVQQAKAAILYPPNGLHTLLYGETGTGKSLFAQTMHEYAEEIGTIKKKAPFIIFNCADYANNPELLMAQLFGVKKGAYTGADQDRTGIVEQADGGILFLDEVHRLPPQGQEMLFYLMDRGVYKRMGEASREYKADILIIGATTENVESILLKTFIRRIPMLIKLPALWERSLAERCELIKHCFQKESFCIKENITVSANCMKALLLYDCLNNIGQLESDIKLCCAKAFLENRVKKAELVVVHSADLPQYVVKGLVKYKEHQEKVDEFINKDQFTFFADHKEREEPENARIFNFYDALDEKRKILEAKGIDAKDIELIMSLDIDHYFKKYMQNFAEQNLEGLYKIVDKTLVAVVEDFLQDAGGQLGKPFNEKILYGLSMHIAKSLERIKSGNEIENHQLAEIKGTYPAEFKLAGRLGDRLEAESGFHIPETEIGFITMFLCMDRQTEENAGRVGIIVAMHGETTATSIVEVANRLVGENLAKGFNMPLEQKTDMALEHLIRLAVDTDAGKGILLLVDMGSLALMGDMICERTKIAVKTIEMVSTPVVIEAARKALQNRSLEEIYDGCMNLSPFVGRMYRNFGLSTEIKNNVIITACITGQGTALKLKSILEQNLDSNHDDVDIIPVEAANRQSFVKCINKVKMQKNVLAIVSAFQPDERSALYIALPDVFDTRRLVWFNQQLYRLKTIKKMEGIIAENVKIDAARYIECFKAFYLSLIRTGMEIGDNTLVGLLLHLASAIERALNGEKFEKSTWALEKQYEKQINRIKQELAVMESAFQIQFGREESVAIVKMLYFL
jgi:transcriptional regulator with AAA-type ATPase domain/transcriptional regulatory protein LevR